MKKDYTTHHEHPWRARLIIGLIMLIFSFIGLVIADIKKEGAWLYWRIMVPVFAILCLWLSWYLRRVKHSLSAIRIWHEILHWCGLLTSVYLVSVLVEMGVMERLDASLMVIILLALTTFIAGIYIEFTFIPIGIMLGLFSLGAALTEEYLYTVMLPITITIAALLVWLIHRMKRRHIKEMQDNAEKKESFKDDV